MAACGEGGPSAEPVPPEPVDVTVSTPVMSGKLTQLPASVSSTDEAEVATRAAGTLQRVAVEVGSRVRAGDTLVVLDETDVRARVSSAEARAERARAYHSRIRALAADGAATPQELDDARTEQEAAEGVVREERAQLSYTSLVAPFDGVVVSRGLDPGDLATPGSPVLSMVRIGSLKVVADVPTALASRLSPGDRLMSVDPSTGRRHPVRVLRRSPAMDRRSRTRRVELQFERSTDAPGEDATESSLPVPGAFVRLELRGGGDASPWVPRDAVVKRGQLDGLFVLRGDTIRLRWVRVGTRTPRAVEVLAGIAAGDSVVRRPGADVADGSPVRTLEREEWSPEGDAEAPRDTGEEGRKRPRGSEP